MNQWKTGQTLQDGTDAGIKNAMATWGEKLSGFADRPECIKTVLDALPPEPPSLPAFVELLRMTPKKETQAALPYKPTQEEIEHQRTMAKKIGEKFSSKFSDGIDSHWATHPKSARQLEAVFSAAKRDARFQPCVDQMISDGICTVDGALLKIWDHGTWLKA